MHPWFLFLIPLTTIIILSAATPVFGNGTLTHYVLLPNLNESHEIQISCGIIPGALEERYHFEWIETRESLIDESTHNITRNISFPTQFQCLVTVEHSLVSDQHTVLYDGPVNAVQVFGKGFCYEFALICHSAVMTMGQTIS